jgi:hypothetical protein
MAMAICAHSWFVFLERIRIRRYWLYDDIQRAHCMENCSKLVVNCQVYGRETSMTRKASRLTVLHSSFRFEQVKEIPTVK